MTTPERLRRRQRIESALVVIVIILSCLSTAWLVKRQEDTQQCLEESVQDLTNALQVRSSSTNALGDLTNERVDLLSQLLSDIAVLVLKPPPTEAQQGEAFRQLLVEYQKDSADFAKRKTDLQETRAQTPYPDYPDGKCD